MNRKVLPGTPGPDIHLLPTGLARRPDRGSVGEVLAQEGVSH
jgi:hypothetical protein